MATIRIAATGDKEKGINEINPRFQANALRNIRGIDCGVLANNFYSEDRDYYGVNKVQTDATLAPFRMISCASSGIQIGAGMATAYGYDFQIEESETVSVLDDGSTSLSSYINNTSGTRYVFVYLEWDITGDPGIGSVKLHGNSTAGIWRSLTTSNANLIDNPRGIYKLPIYRVEITNGTLTYVSWEDMNLCPTITRPQVAEVAVSGVTMDEDDGSERVATCRYVDRACQKNLDDIYSVLDEFYKSFDYSTFVILGVVCDIEKQNGLVIVRPTSGESAREWPRFVPDMVEGTAISGAIPTVFVPTEDTYFSIYARYYNSNVDTNYLRFYCVIYKGANTITLTQAPVGTYPSGTVSYPEWSFDSYFNVGWRAEGYELPHNEYAPVTVNNGEFVHSIPPRMKEGETYTFTVTATKYSEQVTKVEIMQQFWNAEEGNMDGYYRTVDKDEDGTYSFTTSVYTDETGRYTNRYYVQVTLDWFENGTPDE